MEHRSNRSWMQVGFATVLVVLQTLACRSLPDPNAVPATATSLDLPGHYGDALECRRRDCIDWFRVEVPGTGKLHVVLSPRSASDSLELITASLVDGEGRVIGQGVPVEGGDGPLSIHMSAGVTPGTYRFSVAGVDAANRARIGYELRTRFEIEPPQPPRASRKRVVPKPPAQFRMQRIAVLEVERDRGSSRSVLLAAGSDRKLTRCIRGKLIEADQVIGQVELVEIFPEGSRARIVGDLSGAITSRTVAELAIPLGTANQARCNAR